MSLSHGERVSGGRVRGDLKAKNLPLGEEQVQVA
jgi:hypothetical protein